MSELVSIITSREPQVRDRSLDAWCRQASFARMVSECEALDAFRRRSDNLYERVRALFFLYAIHRFHLPYRAGSATTGAIPFEGHQRILDRRYEEAADIFLDSQRQTGPNGSISSALASAYRGLAFQTLAGQVRRSVRGFQGNLWMSRIGHSGDYPLELRRELARRDSDGLFPVLNESTPVRMDLSHSGWSDIFFLGMDYPEGARVLNISIDLAVRGAGKGGPKPPVEAYLRVIDEPVLRLASVDLGAVAELTHTHEVFDFAKDYLGLLKAAVIASGLVPTGLEGQRSPLAPVLERLTGQPGHGIEIVSKVNGIPKGSRLAVSTTLLACLISVCMRATGQIRRLTGALDEEDRRIVAARAILGEWLGGSGGGWQDSGGVWPGVKLIGGVEAKPGDPEFGVSRGRLLPRHHVYSATEVPASALEDLEKSLVLVHGGMAQDVGPILEMVTERYLLRSEQEWAGRREAGEIFDRIVGALKAGNVPELAAATDRNFFGPIQAMIPWTSNAYTETLVERMRDQFGQDFLGFWMLGGMSGGGMGFVFRPERKAEGQEAIARVMQETKRRLEASVPFAMEPVVYDFAINQVGTSSRLLTGDQALLPAEYYTLTVPGLLRQSAHLLPPVRRLELDHFASACRREPELGGMLRNLFDNLLPGRASDGERAGARTLEQELAANGFDRSEHEQIRSDLRAGRIGLAQNRLPLNTQIEDVAPGEIGDALAGLPREYAEAGLRALSVGEVAVVTLAGGAGSRWTRGAGVVKALNPFCRLGGKYRSFVEVHLAKSRQTARQCGAWPVHILTTSFLTDEPVRGALEESGNFGYAGPLRLSPGRAIGLRMIPMVRDLRFLWEETAQQRLDEQAQKMRDSQHSALIAWALHMGEGADYTDNLPRQCLHPVGHWYEVANLLLNGVLAGVLQERPQLRYLLVHNVDTLGANLDPAVLGYHIRQGGALSVEVIPRHIDDRGGGLAKVNGRPRLVEGLALPDEEMESRLSYYNSLTTWVSVERLLTLFGLKRTDLCNHELVARAVRALAARMPTYITIKDVKKRWGTGQEDVYPVAQFEKLWGDITALPAADARFLAVPRERGQQLKEPGQLDGWLRDGSAGSVEALCDWI